MLLVTDGDWAMYRIVELCWTPETNRSMTVNHTSIKNTCRKESSESIQF